LGARGLLLWQQMTDTAAVIRFGAAHLVVLAEACRIADRLERLDRHLEGQDWLHCVADETGAEVRVVVDRLLAEARQQQVTLKLLVAELRQAGQRPAVHAAAGGRHGATGDARVKGAGVADLTERIAAARRAASPG
jgi:hypothetical protein